MARLLDEGLPMMGSGVEISEENMLSRFSMTKVAQTNPKAAKLLTTEEVPFEVGIINVDSDNSSQENGIDSQEFISKRKTAMLVNS